MNDQSCYAMSTWLIIPLLVKIQNFRLFWLLIAWMDPPPNNLELASKQVQQLDKFW